MCNTDKHELLLLQLNVHANLVKMLITMINKHQINVRQLHGLSTLDSKTAKRVFAIFKKSGFAGSLLVGPPHGTLDLLSCPMSENEVRAPHSPGQLKKMPTQDKKKVKTRKEEVTLESGVLW